VSCQHFKTALRSLDEAELDNKRVLVRVDLKVTAFAIFTSFRLSMNSPSKRTEP